MLRREPDEIAAFYNAHPYPPPVEDLERYRRQWSDERRRVERLRLWPNRADRSNHSILVAGCGTSQAAKQAVRHPDARVVGIDVSSASLDAARRLAERHSLSNLELRELAIEEIDELGETFDHIVCTGVIHHLADPVAGLAALGRALAPAGAMELMVYARFGRTGVYMLQEYCRRLGTFPEPDELAELISTLRELPPGHPLSHLLRNTPDFAHDDAIADALLNPRDRAYSVPELFDLLAAARLRFVRWVHQAPYRPKCGALRDLPHGPRIASLPEVDQFTLMELFRGTMVRHSVVAHHIDEPPIDVGFGFDDEGWRSNVPVRATTSMVVGDRLPQGISAALLNRAHTDRDLVLFATAVEHRAFEAIDGIRPMGAIADDRAFFELLWWHDLIVIEQRGSPSP